MREPRLSPIALDQPFQFGCHQQVVCFNACCRDLNQFLTPYDILRLSRHFQMTSRRFLDTFTRQHTGPQTGLPVITLKTGEAETRPCPFVGKDGCRVYPDRPSSCRMYPVARMVARDADTGVKTQHFALLEEPHCKGFRQPAIQTVAEWVAAQQLAPYFDINDLFLELIELKNRHRPGPLDAESRGLFQTALYDLDGFRRRLHLETDGLSASPSGSGCIQQRPCEHPLDLDVDVDLLRYAHQWLKQELFGSPTDRAQRPPQPPV